MKVLWWGARMDGGMEGRRGKSLCKDFGKRDPSFPPAAYWLGKVGTEREEGERGIRKREKGCHCV